jgi:hypothetical protein
MFEVSVLLKEAANLPRLGLTADVCISGAKPSLAVSIPEACVIKEGNQTKVFVVENGSVYQRDVLIKDENNAYLEVEGLVVGEEVVVNSSKELAEGTRVQVISWFTEND